MAASARRATPHHPATRPHAVRHTQGFQRHFKRSLFSYVVNGNLVTVLVAPVIYSLIVPLVMLDIWVTVYQWICFPALDIPIVRRRPFFVMDRHRLGYLNLLERLNCTFCSYANGVIGYTREIQARTEQYWCPIKHEREAPHPHRRYPHFFRYGDAIAYRHELAAMRRQLWRTPR